ncbi:DMT family transporter [Streptomyces sp. BE303]|uniref:DMT family transporter n=1 Tax=Streptomyces sp. BE303 TaxID=3002528 RepID=UPI002E79CBAE|nr:DMT family transporter [Streptomyces sp. BE303]MED7953820.1 DMT family transporter [Streptomyces sp. BE303]
MLLGLTTALVATVCFGFGSVFQARGAREAPKADRVQVGLLAALLRSWQFLLGTGLDVAGFALSIVALRTLPLFLVQAVTNASLAVTGLAAARLLGARLRRSDLLGIAAVVAGLTLLALGSGSEGRDHAPAVFHWALLATTALMLLLTLVLARRSGNAAAAGLGLLAGVGFGVTSLAVRVLDVSGPLTVFTDPAGYALAVGGLGGYLAYALALQRGTVTAATAAGTISETFGPALVGVAALGDAARPGYAWCALTGFAVAVGGTVVLSRFGEVEAELGPAPTGDGARADPAPGRAPAPGPVARTAPSCEGGMPDKKDGQVRSERQVP